MRQDYEIDKIKGDAKGRSNATFSYYRECKRRNLCLDGVILP